MSLVRFWVQDTAVRAVKTAAQSLVGMLGAGAAGVVPPNWQADLVVAAMAGVVCVLQNVATFPTPTAATPTPTAPVAQLNEANSLAADKIELAFTKQIDHIADVVNLLGAHTAATPAPAVVP